MLTVIEDQYPFYVRFTNEHLSRIIDFCNALGYENSPVKNGFIHQRLSLDNAAGAISIFPELKPFSIKRERVSLFITKPFAPPYLAHRDGNGTRCLFGINYAIKVLDDLCVTNWYDASVTDQYKQFNAPSGVHCLEFNKHKHTPIKSVAMKPSDGILFNTDIFHDWDNSRSDHERIILTFRTNDAVTFEQAYQTLFGSRGPNA